VLAGAGAVEFLAQTSEETASIKKLCIRIPRRKTKQPPQSWGILFPLKPSLNVDSRLFLDF
jgi:hypothetical protein